MMKKAIFLLFSLFAIAACSQPKDIYFNGSEGSGSGVKYDKATEHFKLNR